MLKQVQILLLYACSFSLVFAQYPGNVPSPAIWFQTTNSNHYLDSTYYWVDNGGDNLGLKMVNNGNKTYTQQRKLMRGFNFNPSLLFRGFNINGFQNEVLTSKFPFSQFTILGVFAPDSASCSTNEELFGFKGKDTINIYKDKISTIDTTYYYGSDNTLNLLADSLSNSLRTFAYLYSSPKNHTTWGLPTQSSLVFSDNSSSGLSNFNGYIPEFIVYDRNLSQLERRKVETYLALKYGISFRLSYIAPDTSLIWDYSDGEPYNNRITGIAKYTSSKLHQPLSTTSYEEYPRYSVLSDNDSYYQNSSLNKPSDNRLLVFGREVGGYMPNNSFMVWGDDDATSDIIPNTEDEDLWHYMGRKWFVRTNLPAVPQDTTEILKDNIDIENISCGTYSIHRSPNSDNSYVKFGPETNNDINFSFVAPKENPTFDVGINFENETDVKYGYRFHENGAISKKVDSQIDTIVSNVRGHQIDITKRGDNLYLQIDGVGRNEYTVKVPLAFDVEITPIDTLIHIADPLNADGIIIDETIVDPAIVDLFGRNSGYSCYGCLSVLSGVNLSIDNFRVGGFADTGNQLELSYKVAAGLKPYRNRRIILLISDPSDSNITAKYINSEFDSRRQKAIFHNIFLPDSKNYFTFAAFDGLIADFTPYNASCVNGLSQDDGRLQIDIKCGSPLFQCFLIPTEDVQNDDDVDIEDLEEIIREGDMTNITLPDYVISEHFGELKHNVSGLEPGEYEVILKQLEGTNVFASACVTNMPRYYTAIPGYTKINRSKIQSVSWFINDTISQYTAGLSSAEGTVHTGFRVNKNKCYLKNGNIETFYCDVIPGDKISFLVNVTTHKITAGVNDNSQSFSLTSGMGGTFNVIFDEGEATISNLKYTKGNQAIGNANDESIVVEEVKPHTLQRTIFIGSECGDDSYIINNVPMKSIPKPQNSQGINFHPEEQGKLIVMESSSRSFTATLSTADEGAATLLVFDSLGKLINQQQMPSGYIKQATFMVPSNGIYVVKAFTDTEEFSQKIISD